jgi:hypothetical protein
MQPASQTNNQISNQLIEIPTNNKPDNKLNHSTEKMLSKGGVLHQDQIDISQSISA